LNKDDLPDDLDSVDVFLKQLPHHSTLEKKLALKVLVLGLSATTSRMTWGGKVLLARAIKISKLRCEKLDLSSISSKYLDGDLTGIDIENVVECLEEELTVIDEEEDTENSEKKRRFEWRRRRRRKKTNFRALDREEYCLNGREFMKAIIM